MKERIRGSVAVYVGYVLLLVAFVMLGVFVASWAVGSPQVLSAVALVAALGAAVASFRLGAAAGAHAETGKHSSIWVDPISAEQVEVYHARYRAPSAESAAAVMSLPDRVAQRRPEHAMSGDRLSA